MPHDSYFSDLVSWRAFDLALADDFSARRLLAQIDTGDLAQIGLYVYTLALCLNELGERSFTDAYDELLPRLEQFKAVAHEGFGSRVAGEARKKAYFKIKKTIKAPFFEYLLWRHRLGVFF